MNYSNFKESNIVFNDLDGFGYIEDEIVNKNISNTKNKPEINILNPTKLDILSEFNSLIKNIEIVVADFEEIIIDDESNFIMEQHEFLNRYIVIDLNDHLLKIFTLQRKIYIVDLSKISKSIYAVIFESYSPRKILINARTIFQSKYLSGLSINSPYDISHIMKMFYGKEVFNVPDIIDFFFKNTSEDTNCSFYNLFFIKDKLNDVLEKYSLMSLLNKEMSFVSIMYNVESLGLPFSPSYYNEFNVQIDESVNSTIYLIKEKSDIDFSQTKYDKKSLLQLFAENDLYPSLNKDLWHLHDNIEIEALLVSLQLKNKYENYKPKLLDTKLLLNYDLYDNFGNVKSNFEVDGYYICSGESKVIVTGCYMDLYHRIFAGLTSIDYIINSMNNNNFVCELAIKTLKLDNPSTRFNAINILDAYILGYYEPTEVADYFYDVLDTSFDNETMGKILDVFNSNSKPIIKFIDKFSRDLSRDRRICISDGSNLHQYIKMTEADIFKTAIIDVYNDISSFNDSNKYKINLIGLQNNKIILEADEKALNIAIDILNRRLPKAYDKYVRKVQAVCNVSSSSKLK